jgi:hypothetical protein
MVQTDIFATKDNFGGKGQGTEALRVVIRKGANNQNFDTLYSNR